MDIKDVSVTTSQKILGVLIAFACAWVCVSAYIAANSAPQIVAPEQSSIFSRLNFYTDKRDAIIEELDVKAQALAQPLEFMVWPAERKQASQDLISVLRQQLNFEPMNTHRWVQLSLVQADAEVGMARRVWTLRRALVLVRWNYEQRLLLTRHCVVEYDSFMQHAPGLCKELFSHLPPQKPLHSIAQGMGVRLDYLKTVLRRQGLLKAIEASQ